jgi:hypothetical protein
MRASACLCLVASAGCAGSTSGHERESMPKERVLISDEMYVDEVTKQPVYAVARPSGIVVFEGPGRPDLPTQAQARELVANDDAALLQRGATFADAFESGDAEKIWRAFNEGAKLRSDLDAFERLVNATRARIGPRVTVRADYVEAQGHGVAFLREAVHQRAPNGIVLEVSFTPDGKALTDFAVYRAETRPIRLKKVEDGDASR